jgi:hypothetical protein
MSGMSRRSAVTADVVALTGGVMLAVLALVALIMVAAPVPAQAQRSEPEVYGTFDGDPMYTLLPPGAIPAIDEPQFVTGSEADAQMLPDEPVLGLVIGDDARAYSLWQLDSHEIVNDVVGGVAVAATW